MKYQPLLSEVKKFLIETRIIEWCSQCKGYCCGDKPHPSDIHSFYCQLLDDCNNRLACKIHICDILMNYLFCGKDGGDYQRVINYIDEEINKKLMIKKEHITEVSNNCVRHKTLKHHAFHPYDKKMDEIEFDDAKIKFIFKINRKKIAQKIDYLLLNGDNLQCSKTDMDDQCRECTKLHQCALYTIKKLRMKELPGQKSLYV